MKRQIKKKYIDMGFGFPVILLNVPVIKVRGVNTLDINYKVYQEAVLEALAHKPARLSGNEIKFIRHCFEMTAEKFGKRFGNVSHPAVLKWERAKNSATEMSWSTEKDIRMEILKWLEQKAQEIFDLYADLEDVAPNSKKPIEIEADEIAA